MASAWDSDGVVEAIEIPSDTSQKFVLAVQWHPEERLDDLRLFAGVVEAATAYAAGKTQTTREKETA
jgi:putative glutamine amidotransferase